MLRLLSYAVPMLKVFEYFILKKGHSVLTGLFL
jgi:hypothetical protein